MADEVFSRGASSSPSSSLVLDLEIVDNARVQGGVFLPIWSVRNGAYPVRTGASNAGNGEQEAGGIVFFFVVIRNRRAAISSFLHLWYRRPTYKASRVFVPTIPTSRNEKCHIEGISHRGEAGERAGGTSFWLPAAWLAILLVSLSCIAAASRRQEL